MKKLGIILMLALAMSLITIHCVSFADVVTIQHHISSLYFNFDTEPQRATLPPKTGKVTAPNSTLKVNSIKWQALGDGSVRPITLGEDELLTGGKYRATIEVERTAGDGFSSTTTVYANNQKVDSSNVNTTKLGENKLIFSVDYNISTAPTTSGRLSNVNNAAFSNVDILNLDFNIAEPLIGAEPTWNDDITWTSALQNNIEIVNISWTAKSEDTFMSKGEKFKADSYDMRLFFNVKGTNVKFADNAVVTINGNIKVKVDYVASTKEYKFDYTWPTLTKQVSITRRPVESGTVSRPSVVTPTSSVSFSRPIERLSGDVIEFRSGDKLPTMAVIARPTRAMSVVTRPTSANQTFTRPRVDSGDEAVTPTAVPTIEATTAPTVTPTTAPTTAPTVAPTVVPTTAAEEVKKITWASTSKWAIDELSQANDMGIIPTIFDKEDLTKNITRKEFAHVAVKLYEKITGKNAEKVSKNPFTDTKDDEVLKAYNLGITKGVSDTQFDPEALIDREQMATMMTRALDKAGIDTKVDLEKAKKFSDDDLMHSWGREAIYFMSSIDIIKGIGNNEFGVKGNASREAAILISVRSAAKFAK